MGQKRSRDKRGIDLSIVRAPDGAETGQHYYGTEDEVVRPVGELVGDVFDAEVQPDDMANLTTRGLENSLHAGSGRYGQGERARGAWQG